MKSRLFQLSIFCLWIALGVLPPVNAFQQKKDVPPPPLPSPTGAGQKSPEPASQQEDEDAVIKIGTELVNVPFSVTNKQNRYINDLTQEQIQVSEDGKDQEIFSFSKESDLPLTFALMIDVSGSQELSLPAEKEAALKFFDKVMRPDKDIAAVITFRRDVELVQTLTGNKRALLGALNSIRFHPGSYVGGSTPPVNTDPSYNGTSIYDAVFVTSDELLSREAGRRIVVLLTDGQDTTSQYSRDKAVLCALRSEVMVYVIGIPGKGYYGSGRVFSEPVNKGAMRDLAEQTGGRAFFPEKESDFYSAFQQIEEDIRQQFSVSYSPSNSNRDGSFREIKISIKGRPDSKDLKVLSRKGYYAK